MHNEFKKRMYLRYLENYQKELENETDPERVRHLLVSMTAIQNKLDALEGVNHGV